MTTKCFEAEYGVVLKGIPIIEIRRWQEDMDTNRRWDVEVVGRRPASLDELAKANGRPREIPC